MRKVYIAQSSGDYVIMFKKAGFEVVNDLDRADLVCFTGGADVSPHLYGDAAHPQTYNNPQRDVQEKRLFDYCFVNNIPMVGICRGGQFLNVMSGGRMYQHVTKHAGRDHDIIDEETGETITVTSTHHQMFMPSELAKIVATANLGGTREWYDGQVARRDVSDIDYEVLFYEHTKALCFQPHPEFGNYEESRMRSYFFDLIEKYLSV